MDKRREVTYFYGIISIIYLVALSGLVSGFDWKEILGKVPEKYLWFNLVFNLPHIAGSNVLIVDRSIWRKHTRALSLALLMALAFAAISQVYYIKWFLWVHSVWTVKHVVFQQFNLVSKINHFWSHTMKWSAFVIVLLIYWQVYDLSLIPLNYSLFIQNSSIVFLASVLFTFKSLKDEYSRKIFFGNAVLILGGVWLHYLGASFFSVLAVRMVHDMTAFRYYVSAVQGRFRQGLNPLWMKFCSTAFSTTVLYLFIVMSITPIIIFSLDKKIAGMIFMCMSIMHYYSEGFLWKKSGSLRNYSES